MNARQFVATLVAYAMVLLPSCKQRFDTSDVKEVPYTAGGKTIDHQKWFESISTDLKKNADTAPYMTEFAQDAFKASTGNTKIQIYSANLLDSSTLRPLNHYAEFALDPDRENKVVLLRTPNSQPGIYFYVDAVQAKGRGNINARNVVIKANAYRSDGKKFRLQAGEFATLNLSAKTPDQRKSAMLSMLQKLKSFNGRYVDTKTKTADTEKGFNLEKRDYKKDPLTDAEAIFGLISFGLIIVAHAVVFFLASQGVFKLNFVSRFRTVFVVLAVFGFVALVFSLSMVSRQREIDEHEKKIENGYDNLLNES